MTLGPQWTRERLLRPREVAALFNVSAKTVTRWARSGKLPSVRTVGGHRRYPLSTVETLLRESTRASGADRSVRQSE